MAHVNVTEEYRSVLEAAQERGWKPVAQRGGLALLAHPHSFARLRMPLADKDGNPKAVAPDSPEKLAEKIDRTGALSASIAREKRSPKSPKRAAKNTAENADENAAVEPEAPEEQEEPAAGAPVVVSERHPFTPTELRMRPRSPRPTTAVIERTWSDGSVDYACSAVGCDHSDQKMRAVSSHFGAKHGRHGNTPTIRSLMTAQAVAPVDPVDETDETEEAENAAADQTAESAAKPTAEALVTPRTPEDRLAVIRTMLLPADEVAQENLRLRAEIHALQDEVSRLQSALTVVAEVVKTAA